MLRADPDYFALDDAHLVVGTYRLGAKTRKGPLKLVVFQRSPFGLY